MNGSDLILKLQEDIIRLCEKTIDSKWIAIFAVIISFMSLIISLASYIWTKRASKAALLNDVKRSIDDAKTQMEHITLKLAPLEANENKTDNETREFDIQKTVHESSLEKVLNAYEYGCQKYCANLILKDEFKKTYFLDIREYVQAFEDKFTGPLTRYTYIIRLYNEWHTPGK